MKLFILFVMIFCHIADDYYLQGILANLKQKSFWRENAPGRLYRNDWRAALFTHAFSWTFTVMLIPTLVFLRCEISAGWVIIFAANTAVHAFVDNLKANKRLINLICDQTIHVVQVVGMWYYFVR